jgi:hypothetical protein
MPGIGRDLLRLDSRHFSQPLVQYFGVAPPDNQHLIQSFKLLPANGRLHIGHAVF